MREFLKKITLLGAAALLISVLCASSCFAWDSVSEVRRLNGEAPSLEGFTGADALIWLRRNEYKMLPDGTMENTLYSVVMMGEHIPESWKLMKMPVPSDGSVEIAEAAWYNPMTGIKEGNLEVTDETLAGGAVVKIVRTPEAAAGRAVVLVVRTTHEKRYGVDEAIPMAGPLPIWEQSVTVELPSGRPLYWLGKDIKDPVITNSNGLKSYTWKIMNQQAWNGEGFVVYQRPVLYFSFRKGITQSLSSMEETAMTIPTLPVPAFVSKLDNRKAGIKLMEWIADPSRTLTGYPRSWVRRVDQIPENGPWTPWEQTLILNKWLKKLGWESNVWWQSAVKLNDNSPSSRTLWIAPVLEVTLNGNKKVLYEAGQVSPLGTVASSLSGSNIYRKVNDTYEKRDISGGSPSDHSLSLLWLLDLNENGIAEGTLAVTVNGGWTEIISGGTLPSIDGLSGLIKQKINFAIQGMTLTPTAVIATNSGYKLEFKVKCAPGIILAGNLLLRLPGGIPVRIVDMIDKESNYTLRFPFIIDQKVRMNMPKGYKMLQTPPLKKIGEGTRAVLKESIVHWPRKSQLIADSIWIVKTPDIDIGLAYVLRDELAACMRWPVLDIPFRK